MLRDQITDAVKNSMKDQDKFRLAVLRLIQATIKDRDIANKGEGKGPCDDNEICALLRRMIKQRVESARMFAEAQREDLADNEKLEIKIIESCLPQQMNEDDTIAAVKEAISQTGAQGLRDIGKIMAWLKERHSNRMDFSAANGYIRKLLQEVEGK